MHRPHEAAGIIDFLAPKKKKDTVPIYYTNRKIEFPGASSSWSIWGPLDD
jgi:hypothetical protein